MQKDSLLLQVQCWVSCHLILPPNLTDLPPLYSLHSACSLEIGFQQLVDSDSLRENLPAGYRSGRGAGMLLDSLTSMKVKRLTYVQRMMLSTPFSV